MGYEQWGRTNVFRAARAKAAAHVGILRQLNELWRLNELLGLVRLLDFRTVKVAAVRVSVELSLERLRSGGK